MSDSSVFFSIIIPTYFRPQQLATCLEAMTRLNFSRDRFEVIIVDDGSDPPMDSTVDLFRDQLNLRLLKQPNAGPAKARNTGAFEARGKYLAFTDDDCTPQPDWLQALEAHLTRCPNCLIGGQILNILVDNPYSSASQMLVDHLYGYYNADHNQARFFTSNNMAFSAECFRAVGGFDTRYTRTASEDREFCERLLNQGYQLIYAPEAQVYHAHSLTVRSFWQQHFHYGQGAFWYHQARSQFTQESVKVEPLSFYRRLLCHPFEEKLRRPLLLAMLLFLSQVALIAGYSQERLR